MLFRSRQARIISDGSLAVRRAAEQEAARAAREASLTREAILADVGLDQKPEWTGYHERPSARRLFELLAC